MGKVVDKWLDAAADALERLAGVDQSVKCPICGYDRDGLDLEAPCPECGTYDRVIVPSPRGTEFEIRFSSPRRGLHTASNKGRYYSGNAEDGVIALGCVAVAGLLLHWVIFVIAIVPCLILMRLAYTVSRHYQEVVVDDEHRVVRHTKYRLKQTETEDFDINSVSLMPCTVQRPVGRRMGPHGIALRFPDQSVMLLIVTMKEEDVDRYVRQLPRLLQDRLCEERLHVRIKGKVKDGHLV